MKLEKLPLPNWSKVYRICLLVFSGIMAMNASLFILFAFSPAEFTTSNPNKLIPWSLIFAMLFLMGAIIPYLLANLIYGILWITKLRGKGFTASKISSFFLVSVPLIALLSLLAVYFPAIFNIS